MAWTADEDEVIKDLKNDSKEWSSTPLDRAEINFNVPRVRDDYDYKVVQKVWGREVWIINLPYYCGKILEVKKGHHTSMHFHGIKHETMFCVEGQFRIDFIDGSGEVVSRNLTQGDSIVIPPMLPHSIHGVGDFNALFEFSTEHRDEDSIRLGKPG
jgi:oxalate decarboxylase/phosphoglucose isomerase-like protein (cupin superfamily)